MVVCYMSLCFCVHLKFSMINVFPSKITPQIFLLYFFCIYCFPDCYFCFRQQWLVLCLSVFGEMSSMWPISPGRVPSEAKNIMVCVWGRRIPLHKFSRETPARPNKQAQFLRNKIFSCSPWDWFPSWECVLLPLRPLRCHTERMKGPR